MNLPGNEAKLSVQVVGHNKDYCLLVGQSFHIDLTKCSFRCF